MRWLLTFFFLSLVPLCLHGQPPRETEDGRLAAFFRQYLEQEFRASPMFATRNGDHRFDHLLDDVSLAVRKKGTERTRQALAELKKRIDFAKLSASAKIDFQILEHQLTRSLWLDEQFDPYANDPLIYNELISDSVFLLLTQSTLPKETNIRNSIARMKFIPTVLKSARENLKQPPLIYAETAIKRNRGAIQFYESGLFDIVGRTEQRDALKQATVPVVAALKEYQQFLEKELLPRAKGEWRIGKARFARKLELELDAGLTAEQVLVDAETEFKRVESEMYVIARQLWHQAFPGKSLPPDDRTGRRQTIQAVLGHYNGEHGPAENLVRDIQTGIRDIKEFIKRKDILRLPEPDRCQVIEMPEFQRGFSVAYLNPAAPLDPRSDSLYAISPPPRDWDDRRKQSFLQEYNRHMLLVLSIHEAYPGHYVQLEYGNRHPSLIRKVLYSGVFAEGWAVYTEQMMLDEGFGAGSLPLRLNQLKFYLRAIGNALLDYRMHCTNLSDAEATRFLIEDVYQSEGEAVGKVIRAKLSSCQLSTYFVGRMAFYRLRQQTQRQQGDKFNLGRFHETVLSHGTLPVKYLPQLVNPR